MAAPGSSPRVADAAEADPDQDQGSPWNPAGGAGGRPGGRASGPLMRRLHGVSLTRRLVTVVVILVIVAYVLTIAAMSTLLKNYLQDRIDADLVTTIQSASYLPNDSLFPAQNIPTDYVVLAYAPPDYRLVGVAPGSMFNSQSRPDLPSLDWDDERNNRVPFTIDSVDHESHWRVVATQVNNGLTIAVALPLSPVDNTLAEVIRISIGVGLGAAVVVAGIGWLLVRRAFRPLARIEDTAAAIAAGDLTRRVPEHPARDEVGSLSRSVNLMLARIEQSFAVREASEARMRQFVADASHELRTPLATVRGYAELYRQGAVTDPEDVAGALRRIEDEATRMSRLVEDMLQLTRADERRELVSVPVDLTVLANEAVTDARARVPDRTVGVQPLDWDGHLGRVMVRGDEAALRQVVTNLLANALVHTPADTPVQVAVGLRRDADGIDRAVLEVRDHGPGIAPESAERVFERFFRADPSRGRGSGGGSGLGLAIVAAFVGRHGGTVRLLDTPGGGATFRVELQASSDLVSGEDTEPEDED